MEIMLWNNMKNAKYVIGGFIGLSMLTQHNYKRYLLQHDVFGFDGNGGNMLKIITNLTDEEMARLKYVRRIYWHWKGSRKVSDGRNMIQPQEMADRGIAYQEEPYIEYAKRPPHDKYL
jgi:hypothetical protein